MQHEAGPPPPASSEQGKSEEEEVKEIHHDIASFKPKDGLHNDFVQLWYAYNIIYNIFVSFVKNFIVKVAYLFVFSFAFGMESHRRYNMEYIDDYKIVMASGNTVKIMDINTLQHTLLHGVSGSAIGAIAVCCTLLIIQYSLYQ